MITVTMAPQRRTRQYNGQKKMDKMTNNDLQNITQKTILLMSIRIVCVRESENDDSHTK